MNIHPNWPLSDPHEEPQPRESQPGSYGESHEWTFKGVTQQFRSRPLPELSNDLAAVLQRVASKIAPLWPLRDYIAVNPYQGFVDQDWLVARQRLLSHSECEILMPLAHYREVWAKGLISKSDILSAMDELLRDGVSEAADLDCDEIVAELVRPPSPTPQTAVPRHRPRFEPLSAIFDRYVRGGWTQAVNEEIAKHCAAHYDEGQAAWASPWRNLTPYQAWRSSAAHDLRMEILGIRRFRRFVRNLSDTAEATIEHLLDRLRVPGEYRESLLLAEAYSVLGWSAWARYRDRRAGGRRDDGNDFTDLLAIRLAYDAAIAEHHELAVTWSTGTSRDVDATATTLTAGIREVAIRNCLLRASEIAYRRHLLSRLLSGPQGREGGRSVAESSAPRKLAQVVFCIDVRSERIRRALESFADDVDTSGFAGFFGMPIEYVNWGDAHARAQVPALLEPKFRVQESPSAATAPANEELATLLPQIRIRKAVKNAWQAIQHSAVGGFGFVETMGWQDGWRLLQRTLPTRVTASLPGLFSNTASDRHAAAPTLDGLADQGVDLESLADLAHSMLRNLGLTHQFPRLVVFCGHGSDSANNPLKGGLDCGASCGHKSDPNARFAALVLNQPAVRSLLAERGVVIPDDVLFVATMHNTTTDAVALLEPNQLPESHAADLRRLQDQLNRAAAIARAERLPSLPVRHPRDGNPGDDWSEVRPEWGLAGNAAMLIAPRAKTRGVDLDGRVFLHCYDQETDPEGDVLRGILLAPMVVAHWINMQYYASVVDSERFGSGTKTIHNVVGQFGILSGKMGNLRTGLPMQSVHDGSRWRHEPLRLQVVIAASRQTIDRIVRNEPVLRDLVSNGWIYLIAWEGNRCFRYTRSLGWLPIHVEMQAQCPTRTTAETGATTKAGSPKPQRGH
ncbi:MAG: DUF2309 domain-containing protein [Planctomycetaceae bacterium]|nr:MAG: DUF2309 domain-containing protein [Planctomycetaceae bacterium]